MKDARASAPASFDTCANLVVTCTTMQAKTSCAAVTMIDINNSLRLGKGGGLATRSHGRAPGQVLATLIYLGGAYESHMLTFCLDTPS